MLSIVLALALAADVGPFAKPSPEAEFRSLKVSPPLRTAREDWEGARKRVNIDPVWRAWAAQRRSEVDDWMANRRDRVEWVAGWWHDFVNPKDGSFLTWTPDEPGEETLSSPSGGNVNRTPKLHGAWVFGFRTRHAEKMIEAARLYRLTGEARYAEWVASQLDFYAANLEKWPIQTEKSKARLMHQSLDDATMLVRFVTAARVLGEYAPAERREIWTSRLFIPMANLLDETMQRIHNIACWQRSAMAMAAMYAGDPLMWKRAIDAEFGIRKQIEHGVTSEYLWFEQSLGYNNYVVSALLPLFTMASLEGKSGGLEHEMHVIENVMLAPIGMRFPDGQLPNPADATGGMRRVPNPAFLASAYRVFPTPIGLREAAKLRTWDTLVDPPEAGTSVSGLPDVGSRNMETSRMAIVRTGQWQVFFHHGQLHRSHAQAEALNFEAFYGDTDITHDPGTVGYGSPLHTGFYRTALAHNVPVVNGEGQEGWHPGEIIAFAPDRVKARQAKYRRDAAAARELRIDGNRLLDVVDIELAPGSSAARLGLIIHLQGKVTVAGEAVEAPLPYWSNARRAQFSDRITIPVRFARKTMKLTIGIPGPFTITYGTTPDAPPDTRDSLYIEVPGTKARFETVYEGW
jgi:hypothetical protein